MLKAIASGSYSNIAYQLAFNTATAQHTKTAIAYSDRALLASAFVLGFNPSINGNNLVTGLSATSYTNLSQVISFLSLAAANNPTDKYGNYYFSTQPVQDFVTQIEQYLLGQSLYVVQPSDTPASIASQVNSIDGTSGGFPIDAATLQRINGVFSDSSNFAAGGLIHVPTAVMPIGPAKTPLPVLGANSTYVFDPSSGNLYTVGASPGGTNAGLLIMDTTGVSVPTNLITSIDTTATSLQLNLTDGPSDTVAVSLPFSGSVASFVNGLSSDLSFSAGSDTFTGVSYTSSGLQFNLSQMLNGLPVTILANPNGSYSFGLDPSGTFDPLVNFAPNGLNGDTVTLPTGNGIIIFDIEIGAAATVEVAGDFAVSSLADYYEFTSTSGILKLDSPSSFLGTAFGFELGDMIDLAGITATGASLGTDNVLTVQESGNQSLTLNLDPNQNFSEDSFGVRPDGNGGTDLTVSSLVGLNSGAGSLINPTTGAVTELAASNANLRGVTLGEEAAENGYLYVVSTNELLDTIDLTTGQLISSVATTAGNFVADNLTGELVGITGGQFTVVNPMTGTVTALGTPIPNFNGLEIGAEAALDGDFYFVGQVSGQDILYTIDIQTGAVLNSQVTTANNFVADDATGGLVGISGDQLVVVDPATGGTTANSAVISGLQGIKFGTETAEGGNLYFVGLVSGQDILYTIDIATGQVLSDVPTTAGNIIADQTSSGYEIPGATVARQGDTDTVTAQAGQTVSLDGLLDSLDGVNETIIIQGPGTAEISGAASIFDLVVTPGGTLSIEGSTVTTDPVTIDAQGNITGYGTITGGETNNGIVTASGGMLDITSNIMGSGTLTFEPGATLQLEGMTAARESLDFTGSDETLSLGSGAYVGAPITGLTAGDVIRLEGQTVTGVFYDTNTNSLAIQDSAGAMYDLTIVGAYQESSFSLSSGEVLVECFLQGTRIATALGETPVEDLTVGEQLRTYGAELTPIKWIGHRRIDCRRHPDPPKVWPVRVSAGAFGNAVPHRDLWLSPDHAVFAGGVLIAIKRLINETTIAQVPVDEVTYFHIELARHDLLLAEGLPAESYLDVGNRSNFANGGGSVELHPDFALGEDCEAVWEAAACAPLRIEGKEFDRVAERIRRRSVSLGRAYPSKTPRNAGRGGVRATHLAQILNPNWYLANNPDVAEADVDAYVHYINWGRLEGRLPCNEVDFIRALGLIDSGTLIFTMDDVVAAGLDPVEHFCNFGWREGRRPNPYFDTRWYAEAQGVPAGTNPLLHYLLQGEPLGLPPSRHFDPAWYRKRYSIGPTTSPLAHYLKHRRTQRFSPLPNFNLPAYVKAHAATLRPHRDPYAHFLAIGRFVQMRPDQASAAAA